MLKTKKHKFIGPLNEIWKSIDKYEGFYEISNYGRVRSIDRTINNGFFKGKILKTSNRKGYSTITVTKNSLKKGFLVHRLVALAFIPNPKKYPDVNHKDTNKSNNFYQNLEWLSEKENTRHAINNQRMNHIFGENNWKNKISYNQVKEIRKIYWECTNISCMDLSKKYNVSKTCINFILSNRNWYDKTYEKFLVGKNPRFGRNSGFKNGVYNRKKGIL